MNNVIRFPPTDNMTVEQALDHATADAPLLEDVTIVGYTKDGELYFRGSKITREWSLWLALEFQDYIRKQGRYA